MVNNVFWSHFQYIKQLFTSVDVDILSQRLLISSNYKKCIVTHNDRKVQLFIFSCWTTVEKTGENMMSCLKSLHTDVKIYIKY